MSIHAQLSRMTQPSAKASAPAPISPSEDAGVPLSEEKLQEIEQRANAAARGPWTLDDAQSWDVVVWSSEPHDYADGTAGPDLAMNLGADIVQVGSPCGKHDIANGTFIAHAREDVPALLAEVRRLRAVEAQSLGTPQPPREDEIHPDTARLDTAQRLFIGCDFAWGDPERPLSVVVLDVPPGVRVGADFRAFLDAATPEGR